MSHETRVPTSGFEHGDERAEQLRAQIENMVRESEFTYSSEEITAILSDAQTQIELIRRHSGQSSVSEEAIVRAAVDRCTFEKEVGKFYGMYLHIVRTSGKAGATPQSREKIGAALREYKKYTKIRSASGGKLPADGGQDKELIFGILRITSEHIQKGLQVRVDPNDAVCTIKYIGTDLRIHLEERKQSASLFDIHRLDHGMDSSVDESSAQFSIGDNDSIKE